MMQLHLDSRPLGDVLIVQCQGRIVMGRETHDLDHCLQDAIAKYSEVVLQMDKVQFIDSSGLGLLVRIMRAARAKSGDLKLTGVTPHIRNTLTTTHLITLFEIYDSLEEAITAAYVGSRYSRGQAGDARQRILCLCESVNLCTLLGEVLCGAGYNALAVSRVNDAAVLLKATKAKLVVISAHMQSVHGQSTRQLLEQIDPGVRCIPLDQSFASQDPGEAMTKLVSEIGAGLAANG
jgi:anti-sigma B factor antagonist